MEIPREAVDRCMGADPPPSYWLDMAGYMVKRASDQTFTRPSSQDSRSRPDYDIIKTRCPRVSGYLHIVRKQVWGQLAGGE